MQFELRAIDRHFARFMQREAAVPSPGLELAAALVSNVTGDGHICLDLTHLAGRTIITDGKEQVVSRLDELRECLEQSGVVGSPGEYKPLVLDGCSRLYLYRYWEYEQQLARIIRHKASSVHVDLDEELLGAGLSRVFPAEEGEGVDWQKVAAVSVLRNKFCVISGGPGTGKTSTVVKILALLVEQAKGKPLRIALAAPTGKAAARLKESISAMKMKLECTETVRQAIPDKVVTIHSLLGSVRGSIHFRHSASHHLPFDVVIIDEASMVALPLMAKLALALADDARLILLGDRDQLASVEAGAVLGDICGNGREALFSAGFSELVRRACGETVAAVKSEQTLSPLVDSLVILKRNYRFDADSGIGVLGRALRDGEGELALRLCREGSAEISWHDLPGADALKKVLAETVAAGYRTCRATDLPVEALSRLNEFRVLCALRQGPFGVAGMNRLIEEVLTEAGMIDPRSRWYIGRPLMITVNDHNLKLYNGDVGIILPDPEAEGRIRAWFTTPEGGVRGISPLRLPAHETAWCMTVHKSQGSEFGRVLLLLPSHDPEILTRELLYTGITRARHSVAIWGEAGLFAAAVARRIERASGLEDALWESA